jgi:uncharacterized Tic20 family protein
MTFQPELSPSGLPEVQSDEKTMALLCHLSIFVGAIIVPGIIYLIKKDQSPFIAYHALQALIYQSAVIVVSMLAYFAFMIFTTITMGLGAICFPVMCVFLVFPFGAIPFAMKANNGEWAGYPMMSGVGRPSGV